MFSRATIAILLIALVAAPAFGQTEGPPWEVRAYLSTYTDDEERSATETWTWNYTAIRHQHLCSYCGYSTPVPNPSPGTAYTCPDPWGVAGHPADRPLMEASPRQRVLGFLGVEAESFAGLATNEEDRRPLVGRPFRPGGVGAPRVIDGGTEEVGWNADPSPWETPGANVEFAPEDVASYMTLRAQGLDGVVEDDHGLRFLVIEPGAVRAAASHHYLDGSEEVSAEAVFYRVGEGGEGGAEAAEYRVHINPYRVSDGDEYIIRHYEQSEEVVEDPGIFQTTDLNIDVYSRLYGNEFTTGGNLTPELLAAYDTGGTEGGCVVISNSGALRIEIPRQFAGAAGENTWVLKIRIRSNTMTLPRPDELDYDYDDGNGEVYDGLSEPDLSDEGDGIFADLSLVKDPYVLVDTDNSPLLSTADENDGVEYPVVEKERDEASFTTEEIWPYRMPAAAAGRGRAMVQWSDCEEMPTWGSQILPDDRPVFYYTGREWHYVLDPDSPDERLITNQHVAMQTTLDAQMPGVDSHPAYIDTHFMCSRVVPRLTGDNWARYEPGTGVVNLGPAESDLEEATGGFPHIIIGDWHGDGFGGEYAPGTTTPPRDFYVGNRTPSSVLECPVLEGGCGTRYLRGDHQAGDDCPVCTNPADPGGAVELVAVRGHAELLYDGATPLTAWLGGAQVYRMPFDALKFLPGGSMIPMGARHYPQRVGVEVPRYQSPSVPGAILTNDISNDYGYRGMMVAFNRDGADSIGANSAWDPFYLATGSGGRLSIPAEAQAEDLEAACPVCESRYPQGSSDCGYCGASLEDDSELSESALTAEEYAPFGVQVSVLRKVEMAADVRSVDLGWVAPGTPSDAPNTTTGTMEAGSVPMPADVSRSGDVRVRNEGNIILHALMGSGSLYRSEIDPAARSWARNALSLPLTADRLFGLDGAWTLRRQETLGAAGEPATTELQAGDREGELQPVPMGQPVGSYSGEALLFIDVDDDGHLSFYSAKEGDVTTTDDHEFNPDVDEPLEPVTPFAATVRVVESRVPQSDFYSMDMEPALVIHGDDMKVVWVAQRPVTGGAAPAGSSGDDIPDASTPTNIIYSEASRSGGYWQWDTTADVPNDARALTESTEPNDQHSSPVVYVDPGDNTPWVAWHRSLTGPEGMLSEIRIGNLNDESSTRLSGTETAVKGLAGFVRPDSSNHWLLWHAGPEGRERIRYFAEFQPDAEVPPASDLHVSNVMAEDGEFDYFEIGDTSFRKSAQNPFTFTRQPSAFGEVIGGDFVMDVFFAGHIRALGNSDICWARFNFGPPGDEGFPFNDMDDNYGKVAFPNVANPVFGDPAPSSDARGMPAIRNAGGNVLGYAGDRLEPSPRRQSFQARDIDWRLSYDYETDPDWTGWLEESEGIETYSDAKFYVSVVSGIDDDLSEEIYAVLWEEGSYDRSTGLYTVVPQLVRIGPDFSSLPANPDPGPPVWHPLTDDEDIFAQPVATAHARALLSPSARGDAEGLNVWNNVDNAQRWPAVTLQINPASGTVTWSSMLFNPDDPADSMAVFNEDNTPQIADVVMYADYRPFVKRVTTDDANDDSPTAFYDGPDRNRLTVFWRRSYGDTDAPHFGRPTFMYRTWTRSMRLGHTPSGAVSAVHDLTSGVSLTGQYTQDDGLLTVNAAAGESPLSPRRIGHRVRVEYSDTGGIDRVEQHRVLGWSVEMPVPVNNVVGEGPLRVFREIRQIGGQDATRFWLVWSSPRGVYDIRPDDEEGQRVHQATDAYLAVVSPDYSSLVADLEVARVGQ